MNTEARSVLSGDCCKEKAEWGRLSTLSECSVCDTGSVSFIRARSTFGRSNGSCSRNFFHLSWFLLQCRDLTMIIYALLWDSMAVCNPHGCHFRIIWKIKVVQKIIVWLFYWMKHWRLKHWHFRVCTGSQWFSKMGFQIPVLISKILNRKRPIHLRNSHFMPHCCRQK